jgi:hypothetical protein
MAFIRSWPWPVDMHFITGKFTGPILMLVDVPKERIDEIQKSIRKHHPEAEFEGIEPTVKLIPQKE